MTEPGPITTALLILLVIMIFNLIIFVHELGHFLAAKWRGLKIDRFQIWFGKPIWSKTIRGVQYGLGWIPAGGFVALPQMAPMEAIEGGNRNEDGEPLPEIKPLDKIIVAFAGPLFSFLLALVSALLLTAFGKPENVVPTTTVGWVQADSPAEDAGFQRGDEILEIDGQPVETWSRPLDSVHMHVVTSRNDSIRFTIDRPGEGRMELRSDFEIEDTKWWQRKKTREVGLVPMAPDGDITVSGFVDDENAPARLAGLEKGDVILEVEGEPIIQYAQMLEMIARSGGRTLTFTVERDGERVDVPVTPVRPVDKKADSEDGPLDYMVGARFDAPRAFEQRWEHPGPIQQVKDTLRTMWITVRTIAAPDSSIGIQHLSGPVGIGKLQYFLLQLDYPFHRILGFMVLININLALLNLLPFPVLDGGHITIAGMEAIARRPVNIRFLEVLQMAFVFILFSIMLYVTSKDIVDDFGMGGGDRPEIVFPEP